MSMAPARQGPYSPTTPEPERWGRHLHADVRVPQKGCKGVHSLFDVVLDLFSRDKITILWGRGVEVTEGESYSLRVGPVQTFCYSPDGLSRICTTSIQYDGLVRSGRKLSRKMTNPHIPKTIGHPLVKVLIDPLSTLYGPKIAHLDPQYAEVIIYLGGQIGPRWVSWCNVGHSRCLSG